jgi:hypothetical protein
MKVRYTIFERVTMYNNAKRIWRKLQQFISTVILLHNTLCARIAAAAWRHLWQSVMSETLQSVRSYRVRCVRWVRCSAYPPRIRHIHVNKIFCRTVSGGEDTTNFDPYKEGLGMAGIKIRVCGWAEKILVTWGTSLVIGISNRAENYI